MLAIGIGLLVAGLGVSVRGMRLRRRHREGAGQAVTIGADLGVAAEARQRRTPRRRDARDPRDWLRFTVEGVLLIGVGLAFALRALTRLLG
jgi:hypothetical protein